MCRRKWSIGASVIAWPPYYAPYNFPGSDNAYVHYSFIFSAGGQGSLMRLSNLDHQISADTENNGVYYPTWTYSSGNISVSPDGNLQRGTESRFGEYSLDSPVYETVSAAFFASLTPSNYPSCGIDLICSAQTRTDFTDPQNAKIAAVQAVAGASFLMTITAPTGNQPADQQPTGILTVSSYLTTQLDPNSAGQNGAYLPVDRIITNNPFFPSYIFTNVPSASLAGISTGDGVDYEFNFIASSPCLVTSIILPNCTNSLNVSVSNLDIGTFSGGQTVYFTNFPSGGVGQFSIFGNGQPLPESSGLECPLTLSFNSPTGAFTLTPSLLRIAAPVTDQSLRFGQDLTIQPIVGSEQPVRYQWQLADNDLLNETNALLAIPNFTITNAGRYRLKMQSDVDGHTQIFYSPESSVVAVSPPSLAYAGVVNGSNNLLQFRINGNPAQGFILQSSTDLQNWQPIATNCISTNGSADVQISNGPASTVRFIRTASPTTLRMGPIIGQ